MSEMKKMTLEQFANELSSNSPAPGGGTVAAFSASLSASLASMVFSLTTGKKAYNEYDDEIKNKIDNGIVQANALKNEFLKLMDEDTEAFNEVMSAFKMPKGTDEEKVLRSAKIQEGYVKAMEVPLTVAKRATEIFDFLEFAAQYGNPNAISDAGVGALLAMTALEGAILNVRINLGGIKDESIVKRASLECDNLIKTASEKKEKIMKVVMSKM